MRKLMESSIADDRARIEIHLNRATVWAQAMRAMKAAKLRQTLSHTSND
jgi:hypothetical protein